MKYRGLGVPSVQRRYLDLFAAHGVAPQRLELLPSSPSSEYLAAYHQVDVALDPFPFSGSATTCEALWMGVPVVTCPGETFASRHSLTHLQSGSYGNDRPRPGRIRGTGYFLGERPAATGGAAGRIRERMAASPLCDGKRFATNLTSMLRELIQSGNK